MNIIKIIKKHIGLSILFYSFTTLAETHLTISVNGVKGEALTNVEKSLNAQKKIYLKQNDSIIGVNNFYNAATANIDEALNPFGYFKSKIVSKLRRLNSNNWIASYYITLGPPLKIQQLRIIVNGVGSQDPDFRKLLNNLPLKQGDVFLATRYRDIKNSLFSLANNKGYLAAKMFQSRVQVDLKNNSANILIIFDTGPRYTFGPVTFSQNPYADALLQRYIRFKVGEFYDSAKLQQLQQDLSNSNYFRYVNAIPQLNKGKYLQVPIYVQLIPNKSQLYDLGLGYNTDTGINGLLGIELRRLTDSGQQFKATANLSQVQNNVTANYRIPGKNPAIDHYDISASVTEQDDDLGKQNARLVAAGYTSEFFGWQQVIAFTFINADFSLLNKQNETANMLVPSISWLKIKSDNAIHPRQGYRLKFSLQGSPAIISDNTNFVQARMDGKYIYTVGEDNRIILVGAVGSSAINNLYKLPLNYQFALGGTQTIRGYAYQSIAPGKNLALGSVEWQYRLKGNWYATTFLDSGSVSNKFLNNIKKGAGFGVAWLSPIGTLELTAGKALDLPGQPIRIQFTMGPDL